MAWRYRTLPDCRKLWRWFAHAGPAEVARSVGPCARVAALAAPLVLGTWAALPTRPTAPTAPDAPPTAWASAPPPAPVLDLRPGLHAVRTWHDADQVDVPEPSSLLVLSFLALSWLLALVLKLTR